MTAFSSYVLHRGSGDSVAVIAPVVPVVDVAGSPEVAAGKVRLRRGRLRRRRCRKGRPSAAPAPLSGEPAGLPEVAAGAVGRAHRRLGRFARGLSERPAEPPAPGRRSGLLLHARHGDLGPQPADRARLDRGERPQETPSITKGTGPATSMTTAATPSCTAAWQTWRVVAWMGRASGRQSLSDSAPVKAGTASRPSLPTSFGRAISLSFSCFSPCSPTSDSVSRATTGTSSLAPPSAATTSPASAVPAAKAASADVTETSAPPSSSGTSGCGMLGTNREPTRGRR